MKLRKKFILMLSLILVLSLCVANVSGAPTLDDLQKQQQALKDSMADNATKKADAQAQAQDVNDQLKELDTQLTTAATALNDVNNQLSTVNDQLVQSQKDLVSATAKKDQQRSTLEKRLRYMYEYGNISYFETIFSATSFTDFLNRIDYIGKIADYDQNIYKELEKTEKEITDTTNKISDQKSQIEILQKTQQQKTDALKSSVEAKQALADKIAADIDLINQQDAQEAQSSKDIEKMIKEEQAKAAAANTSSSGGTYTGGKLMWPVPSCTTITSEYGMRFHPIEHVNRFHSGIDIGCPSGSSVVSAADGKCIYSSWMQGYGNTVIIDHGGGLSTLYGHLSVLVVNVGDSVTKGKEIAKSGNTGNSTGAHCHFEVRINGKTANPLDYVGAKS